MRYLRMTTLFISLYSVFSLLALAANQPNVINASVDATEMYRHLLHGTVEYTVKPGTYELYYPQWIPGIHAPENPIRNLAEITVTTPDGKTLEWERNVHNVYHFSVQVPQGVDRIIVKTTYICNQNTVNSTGVDSYGNSLLGIINWNTILLYPTTYPANEILVDLKLTLPEGWKWGASLVEKSREGDVVTFETVDFEELVDSPVIFGKYYNQVDITPESEPKKHYFHLVSESEQAIQIDEEKTSKMKNMVREAMALFGTSHYDSYHLLLVLSDSVPYIGLEHLKNSLNATPENSMTGDRAIPGVLAHEFAHSWCGKYHIPQGMITTHFNMPKDTHMLWVYEGLDQYIGKLLEARAGHRTTKENKSSFNEALKDLGRMILYHERQKGRRSISLEDTSASSYLRRGGSRHWRSLHRGQDYYNEGAMLWMEIDAILRSQSGGQKSLNDFCKTFLGRHEEGKAYVGYTEEDVINSLNSILEYDWTKLIDEHVRGLHESIPLHFVEKCGYRIQFTNKPTDFDKDMIITSLGLNTDDNGKITAVIPGSPADQAGLYENATIIGVNDRKFSKKRLEDAIQDSVVQRKIELLMLNGDIFENRTIEYAEGPKYMELVRNEDKPDLLKEIWKPMVVDLKEE